MAPKPSEVSGAVNDLINGRLEEEDREKSRDENLREEKGAGGIVEVRHGGIE